MTFKAPNRRALASRLDHEVAPAVNTLVGNTAFLKRELDTHWARIERMDFAFVSFKSMTFWQRVTWLVRGA